MKKFWSILSVVCMLTACDHDNKEIKDQIINSDPAKEFKTIFDKAFFIQTVYSSIKK